MTLEIWRTVDDYLSSHLVPEDPSLVAAAQACREAGLPDLAVTPSEGKFLNLIAHIAGARTVLEIGTLGGYSTIWLARALPSDGRVVTLEADPGCADVARKNIDNAGLSAIVDVRVGPALRSLSSLRDSDSPAPFDLVFVDADKANNPAYFRWALELTRPGSILVVDNVVRSGGIADPASTDANIRGTQEMIDLIVAEPRVDATALQTVGRKGHDGFLLARVTG